MAQFTRILVGLKLAESDDAPLRLVGMLAGMDSAREVHFVHVSSRATRDDVQAAVRKALPDLSERVAVTYAAVDGPVLDRLLEYAADQQIDLAVLGTNPDPARRSVLERRMAMKAPCSIWVVPYGTVPRVKRIVVPVDFSEASRDALAVAASLGRLLGASCLALHVYFNEAVTMYDDYDAVLRGREREAYDRFVADVDLGGVTVEPLFEECAVPAHAIERAAEQHEADLVVMSTRGRSSSAAVLLGSVTEQVLAESSFSTLVVKHFGARMGLLEALLDKVFHQGSSPEFD